MGKAYLGESRLHDGPRIICSCGGRISTAKSREAGLCRRCRLQLERLQEVAILGDAVGNVLQRVKKVPRGKKLRGREAVEIIRLAAFAEQIAVDCRKQGRDVAARALTDAAAVVRQAMFRLGLQIPENDLEEN